MPWPLGKPSIVTYSGHPGAQLYRTLIQYWQALRERDIVALNHDHWPKSNSAWFVSVDHDPPYDPPVGVVTSFDGTTLADSTAHWPTNRWYNYFPPAPPPGVSLDWIPRYYDVVVEVGAPDDPAGLFRFSITGNDLTTLTVAASDALQQRRKLATGTIVNSWSQFVGRPYYILKQGGEWQTTRWPEFPQGWIYEFGIVTAGSTTTLTDGTRTVPVNTRAPWASNQWTTPQPGGPLAPSSFDVVWDDDGVVKRATIAANTGDTLSFSAAAAAPPIGAKYVILPHDDHWRDFSTIPPPQPAAIVPASFYWYRGRMRGMESTGSSGEALTAKLPEVEVTYSKGDDPAFCENVTIGLGSEDGPLVDVDVWTPFDDQCAASWTDAEKPFHPDLFKSFRQLQVALEGLVGLFVPPIDYDGAATIPTFSMATWLEYIGGETVRSTITFADGSKTATIDAIDPPYTPFYNAFYAVLHPGTNDVIQYGDCSIDTTTQITETSPDPDSLINLSDHWIGYPIVIAFGWPRDFPRQFIRWYDGTAFIPDIDGEGGVYDPPAWLFPGDPDLEVRAPGSWETDTASTAYAETVADVDGSYFGATQENGPAFVTGDVARYVGHNWHQPAVRAPGGGLFKTADTDPTAPYYRRLFEGKYKPIPQAQISAQMSGTATSGGNFYLEDTSRNWWKNHPMGSTSSGVLRTETGTASGGSTTTLIDTSKIAAPASPFWDTATGRWVGFILEITSGPNAGQRRAITAFNQATATLTVSPAFPSAVGAGATYQIREPAYILNWWRARGTEPNLTIIEPNGTTQHTVAITHSDDNRLYFAPQPFAVEAGWSYRIDRVLPGGCWRWNGSAHVKPTGEDPRGAAAGYGTVNWHDDQTENLPTRVHRYGRLCKGDYVTKVLMDLLYDGINALTDTRVTLEWDSRTLAAPTTVFKNHRRNGPAGVSRNGPDWDGIWSDVKDILDTAWPLNTGSHPTELRTNPPEAWSDGEFQYGAEDTAPLQLAQLRRTVSHPTVRGLPTLFAHAVDYYAFSEKSAFDADTADTLYDSVFDNNGDAADGALIEKRFAKVGATAATFDADTQGSLVGTADLHPTWCSQPRTPDIVHFLSVSFRGYTVTGQWAVAKWDVPGGFRFVA